MINNNKEFPEILYIDEKYFTILFYFNQDNIHKKLFEDNNKAIIDKSEIESISYLFYLTLPIIRKREHLHFFQYEHYLYNSNYFQKNEKKETIKLLLSKSINDFIGKYGFSIKKINENILEDNFFSLEKIVKKKYVKIKVINVEELYTKVKYGLKFLDKFYNVVSQLGLESKGITKKICNELYYNINEKYFHCLNLKNNNFYNEKIYLYYILFKYLLKNKNYIYNVEFLNKLRSNNFKIVKSGLVISEDNINDSKYHLKKYCFKNDNKVYINKANTFYDCNFSYEKKENSKIKSIVKTRRSSSFDDSSSFHSLNNYNRLRSFTSYDYNLTSINYEGNQNNKELISFEKSKKDKIDFSIYNTQNFIFSKKSSQYNILEFIKIMGKHENKENAKNMYNNSDLIKEINKGLFISFGSNTVILYDQYFNIIGEISLDYNINNIYEINDKINSKIMIVSDNGAYIINFYFYSLKYIIQRLSVPKKKYDFCLEISKDNYYFFGLECKYHYINLFNKKNKKKRWRVAMKYRYKGGIKINEDLILLTSNRLYPNGEDKLIIYNINRKRIIYKAIGYSFIFSNNGLSCIKVDNSNNIIIFCACKRYFSDQKNGILIIYLDIKEEKVKSKLFYETNNFEVYCFCPILKIENNANLLDGIDEINNSENIITKKTDFFFVGGFNKSKNEGLIKLFKVYYELNYNNINIDFIQDININKKENNYSFGNNKEEKREIILGFKGPITCIIQTRKTGNILVTCWDRNVYLFTPPNFDIFIKNKEEKYNFINSLIYEKNSNKSIKVDESDDIYSSISYFKNNPIEYSSINRKLSCDSSVFKNYSSFNLIDYYLFKDNKIDIKQIIQKSCIKIYSKKDKENIIFKYGEIIYGDKCKISYKKLKKLQEFPNNGKKKSLSNIY